MKKTFLQFVYGAIAVFIFGLVSCPALGQVQTKITLTEKDYPLWGTLRTHAISDNGKWVSYAMTYESNADTLFVVNTTNGKKYTFPKVREGKFSNDETFANRKQDTLTLLSLSDGKKMALEGVVGYDMSADGDYLITEEKATASEKRISVRTITGQLIQTIDNIGEYVWNDAKNSMAYTTVGNSASVGIIALKEKPDVILILKNPNAIYSSLRWQEAGVVFYSASAQSETENTIGYYNAKESKLYTLNNTAPSFPKNNTIDTNMNVMLQVSEDGSKVFFGIRSTIEKPKDEFSEVVEIWNANDKVLYPDRKLIASIGNKQLIAVWRPKTGLVKQLTTDEESWMMLTGNQQYAITANPLRYEPQYKLFADMDYYLTELSTGNKIRFLEKQSGDQEMIRVAPDGKYITYFRDGNWWMYNIPKKTHVNLTKGLLADWDNHETDPGNQQNVWGFGGWTKDNKSVLYYDYYDIWLISIDGKKRKKLTQGRENKIRFRLAETNEVMKQNYSGLGVYNVDLSKKIWLQVLNLENASSVYCILDLDEKNIPLVMKVETSSRFIKAKNSEAFVYETQRFDSPPTIMFKENKDATDRIVFRSNPQHDHYLWGSSEMIHYNSPDGKELNGALFYPAEYDVTKKYPMIVWIYETVSRDLNRYVNPTLNNTLGFNITNLTAKGYLVLLADIDFEKGKPGESSVACVTAAVNKVVEMGCTEKGKIGLMGQSFGAYETNFIITQTNLFSAAVSGSGVTDVAKHYFTLNSLYSNIDAWRYENQQYRMGKPFFDNPQGYLNNSPLMQAAGINTPLLTWAGLQDENVQPLQALTFYVALRRLNKKNIMLRYPDDGHIFYKTKNQIDLTNRIQQWFDYFLKKEPALDWIKNGLE